MTEPTPPKREPLRPAARRFKPERARLTGFIVLLDACTLVSATLRDVLLCAAEFALFRPKWNQQILFQVREQLVSRYGVPPERAEYLINQVCVAMFPDAEISGYESLIAAMRNAEDDRHVLAVAILGKAQVIVTADVMRFPADICKNYNIEALTPDEFLCDLLDVDPDRMLDVLSVLSARRTMPEKTIDDLLVALENSGCPQFAGTVRKRIEGVYGIT